MQLTLKRITKNSTNSFKCALAILTTACGLLLASSCDRWSLQGETNKDNDLNLVLDSLRIELDSNGNNALVKIIEVGDKQNRVIEVDLRKGDAKFRTLKNDDLIPCATCGRQSGEPFTTIDLNPEIPRAFNIYLEYLTYTFVLDSENAYLNKIDLFHVTPAEDKYMEWHETYTTKDFGKLGITQVKAGLELELRDSATLDRILQDK